MCREFFGRYPVYEYLGAIEIGLEMIIVLPYRNFDSEKHVGSAILFFVSFQLVKGSEKMRELFFLRTSFEIFFVNIPVEMIGADYTVVARFRIQSHYVRRRGMSATAVTERMKMHFDYIIFHSLDLPRRLEKSPRSYTIPHGERIINRLCPLN